MLTRRRRYAAPRPHRVTVRLSTGELAAVQTAATGDGFAMGAWIAVVACRQAAGGPGPGEPAVLQTVLAELNLTRTQLARAGVLFNQVVAALHSVGVADDRLAATAAYVAGRVRRVDAQLDRLQAMLP